VKYITLMVEHCEMHSRNQLRKAYIEQFISRQMMVFVQSFCHFEREP